MAADIVLFRMRDKRKKKIRGVGGKKRGKGQTQKYSGEVGRVAKGDLTQNVEEKRRIWGKERPR